MIGVNTKTDGINQGILKNIRDSLTLVLSSPDLQRRNVAPGLSPEGMHSRAHSPANAEDRLYRALSIPRLSSGDSGKDKGGG